MSAEDIWNLPKELNPGETLPSLFWVVDADGKPLEVTMVARKELGTPSRLVCLFEISADNEFQAHIAHKGDGFGNTSLSYCVPVTDQ